MYQYGTKDFNVMLAALKTAHANGCLLLYTGSQPTNPDSVVTGTLIGRVTKDGGAWVAGSPTNGINMADPVLNVMSKDPTETWKFTALAAGTIGWGQWVGNAADDGAARVDLPRNNFTVGITSGDARTSKVSYQIGEVGTIDSYTITLTNI